MVMQAQAMHQRVVAATRIVSRTIQREAEPSAPIGQHATRAAAAAAAPSEAAVPSTAPEKASGGASCAVAAAAAVVRHNSCDRTASVTCDL
jgi:hypothetical protein